MRSGRAVLRAHARFLAGVFFVALAGGCAIVVPEAEGVRETWPSELPESAEIVEVPFFPQEEYQCGPAALATLMVHSGATVTPGELAAQVYLPARKGSLQVEMLAAPRRRGLVSHVLAPRTEDVLREVASGTPVVVLQSFGVQPFNKWHYSVVVGFDRGRGAVRMRSGTHRRHTMTLSGFEQAWKESRHWAMVTVKPERIPVTATESGYLDALHAMARVSDAWAAMTGYAAFLQRWPANLGAKIGLANVMHREGLMEMAEDVLRDALEKHQGSVVVMNNLAQVLSDRGSNGEALALIDDARKIGGPFAAATEETRRSILERIQGQ